MTAQRTARLAAAGTLLGIVLSGPTALVLVNVTHPQPPWQSARLFAASYHPVQSLPYLGGIVLVAALVVLIASLHALARDDHRALSSAALVFTAAFASMIFLNYTVQLAFLPLLARDYDDANAPLIAALSMVNPRSLSWALEMWGWAFLGVATWLVAPVLATSKIGRLAARCFVANGPISLAGALLTVTHPGWVQTPAGLTAFSAWNALLAAMAVLARLALRDAQSG